MGKKKANSNPEPKKSTIAHDAIALCVITLVAGFLLGLVYKVTEKPIEDASLKAKQEAYQTVFPDAASFEASDQSEALVKEKGASYEGAEITEYLLAKDSSGNEIGYVVSFTAKEGYGGDIRLSMGIDKDGAITGFEVLSNSETAGLGQNCVKPAFKDQFKGINADSIEWTKDGKSADNQIDALSGATITTKAVTKGVNAALSFIKQDVMSAEGGSADE